MDIFIKGLWLSEQASNSGYGFEPLRKFELQQDLAQAA